MESFKKFMSEKSRLDELVESLKNIYPGLTLFVSERSNEIHIHEIKVENKNKGTGTKVMQAIQQYARLVGKPITLSPQPEPRKKAKLLKFYKGLGFHNNSGRRKDYRYGGIGGPTWIWRP
jgi:GNAT superfamily N-acetyltransferase